jgi:anti-anti-sigma factor
MWHNRSLRTRILLGYGLILGLASALALFLVLHVGTINQNMQQLNQSVASETEAGMHMTSDVAALQQSVNRYLQQPQSEHLHNVQAALRHLTTDIDQVAATLQGSTRQTSVQDLKRQLQVYHSTFESLSRLLREQEPLHGDLNRHLSRAAMLLRNMIAQAPRGDASTTVVSQLAEAQASLQQASLWIVRLSNEPSTDFGMNAIEELNKANLLLKKNAGESSSVSSIRTDSALNEIALASRLVSQLIQSIEQVQQQRDTELARQGNQLKAEADAIARHAMTNLTTTTNSLANQTRRTQGITGAALLITLLVVLVVGISLAHTITQPLKELVTATTRLAHGDYDATVSQADGSEIGQLATIFNQMTGTLRQQRAEVLQQQEAIVSRNQELEHALAEVRAATEARDALDMTVRLLTVPVVPILDNVIVVPLVGEINEQRAQTLIQQLLDGIAAQHATIAILDITGVPFVDTAIVERLVRVANAARLLGARCLLVGIRPEVAQTMVASGASLDGFTTRASLRDAVEYALQAGAFAGRSSLN